MENPFHLSFKITSDWKLGNVLTIKSGRISRIVEINEANINSLTEGFRDLLIEVNEGLPGFHTEYFIEKCSRGEYRV